MERIGADLEAQERAKVWKKGIMNHVPIWEKVSMTIEETAEYSNIGTNRLRALTDNPQCDFVIRVGNKKLIKRKEFEKFLSENSYI